MYSYSFRAFRPRHPLARIAVTALAVIAVLALVMLSLFAVAAIVIGGGLFLLFNALRGALRPAPTTAAAPSAKRPPIGVIEGEYTVVPSASTHDASR